jgi:predicted transcriptional regulator YheO
VKHLKKLEDEPKLFKQILDLISSHFGTGCEVVLHDLTNDYNHTIVDIRNGHITNRTVGGCGSNLGLEVLNGSVVDGDRYNYVTTTPDGKVLRSSSIYIRDSDGNVIGSICVNLDITETMRFSGFLSQYNHYDTMQTEFFAQDVSSLLDYLIQQAKLVVNKEPKIMTKDERLAFLSYLDRKGAFLISKSSIRICEELGISKFTLYNDLDAIRGTASQGKGHKE